MRPLRVGMLGIFLGRNNRRLGRNTVLVDPCIVRPLGSGSRIHIPPTVRNKLEPRSAAPSQTAQLCASVHLTKRSAWIFRREKRQRSNIRGERSNIGGKGSNIGGV